MKYFPRSKKKRIVKKWFKKTGMIKPRFVMFDGELYIYKIIIPK